jgi:hypothetical protein
MRTLKAIKKDLVKARNQMNKFQAELAAKRKATDAFAYDIHINERKATIKLTRADDLVGILDLEGNTYGERSLRLSSTKGKRISMPVYIARGSTKLICKWFSEY